MSVLVGTAGWADKDLIASGWYPAQVRKPADRLRYYAGQFPLVEVDSSYYAIPRRSVVEGWAQIEPDAPDQSDAPDTPGMRGMPGTFVMDVKAYSLLTGHRTRVASLPSDLQEAGAKDGAWINGGAASDALVDEAWRRFHDACEPLRTAERLGLIVLQFPPACRPGGAGEQQIEAALEHCAPLRAAVEFRHGSWLAPQQRDRTLDLLRAHGAAYVCVDMPQGHTGAVPPLLAVTSDKAIIRLHGRSKAWVGGSKEDRYRYEYEPDELAQWANHARELARHVDEVHVVVNTCCAGAAQRDAARLRDLLAS